MKQLRLLLTLMMVGFCSLSQTWADEVVVQPDWSDYPVNIEYDASSCSWHINEASFVCTKSPATLSGKVVVDKPSTLFFRSDRYYKNMEVLLDDEIVYDWDNRSEFGVNSAYGIYSIPIAVGEHTIKWVVKKKDEGVYDIGIMSTPLITVNLLEPGSLGTEVLAQLDHVRDVRNLKIIGKMNDDDWGYIDMMPQLSSLDLSEAVISEIPDSKFSNISSNGVYIHKYLMDIKLPATLKRIGNSAFYLSNLHTVSFAVDSQLESIGTEAFKGTKIEQIVIPESVRTIGIGCFYTCYDLTSLSLPSMLNEIPNKMCIYCYDLENVTLPSSLTRIGDNAFKQCYKQNPRFPNNITYIGYHAYEACAVNELILPENCTELGEGAFHSCPNLEYIELPVKFYKAKASGGAWYFNNAPLKTLVIKSPTLLPYTGDFLFGINKNEVTVKVPEYLVTSYKLDPYWADYEYEGFSTAEISDWTISQPLVLNRNDRFEGQPNITLDNQGTLKINGETPMTINNFTTHYNIGNTDNQKNMVLSNCNNISIQGSYIHRVCTRANRWYFVCLPFDTSVSDITNENDASFAIRYYDGASRATGTGGNWKDYADDAVISAGTGFIFQTSKDGWSNFKAQNNSSKQNIFKKQEFVKPLEENASETTANRGWNLVGNPFLTYYNIHKLNFTAPITVYDNNNNRYTAYSIIDDDYAILPNQAFFVQCPDEVTEITFPVDGKQLTDVIESQNGAKPFGTEVKSRRLIDVELGDGEQSDKTRLVLNENAAITYEMNCDASKFMNFGGDGPQIFSVDAEGIQYAINERPLGDGVLPLTVIFENSGQYTISAPRNEIGSILLIDHETGIETDLATAEYTFYAEAGTIAGRFELNFNSAAIVTNIDVVNPTVNHENGVVYNLQGVKVADGSHMSTLPAGVYVVRSGQKTQKVTIK